MTAAVAPFHPEPMPEPNLLRLLSAVALSAGAGVWNELLQSGTKFGLENVQGRARSETITPEDIEALVDTFPLVLQWYPRGPAVTANHAPLLGALDAESSKALGRLKAVEVRPNLDNGLSLWGLIEWTSEGGTRVNAGEFSGFSVEMVPGQFAANKDTGEKLNKPLLVGGTVCNDPFWPGLEPLRGPTLDPTPQTGGFPFLADSGRLQTVALSEQASPRPEHSTMKTIALSTLAATLALPADTDEASAIAQLSEVKRRADESDTHKAAATRAMNERDEARTALGEAQGSLDDERFTALCKANRCVPADRGMFDKLSALEDSKAMLDRMFPEGANALFSEQGHDGDEGARGEDGINAEDKFEETFEALVADGKSEAQAYTEAKRRHGKAMSESYWTQAQAEA